jgi:hypothetical protein
MKAYGGVDMQIHICLTAALVGDEWSTSRSSHFTPSTHRIGGWVSPGAGLDDVKRKFLTLPELELRPLGRLARSPAVPNMVRVKLFLAGHGSRAVFSRLEAGIVGSNPTQGMDV